MNDQPNITVVYQQPKTQDVRPWWVIPVVVVFGFIFLVSMLCNGLAYLFH